MNQTTKVIVGAIAGFTVLCLIACLAGYVLIQSAGTVLARVVETDTDRAAEIASSIAEYSLPDGFGNPHAIRMAGFTVVTYNHSDGHSHASFFQIPDGIHVDAVELERQYHQSVTQETHTGRGNIEMVDQQPGEIDGQPVTLIISEGTNSDQQPFREVSAIFEGKGGQTLVVYEAPLSRWDQAEVDAFLSSIH